MRKMLIDFSGSLIRTAVIEDGELIELILDKKESMSLVSNIYAGVVKNILPSEFVFLDIGQERNAFLQLNDKKEKHLFTDRNKLKIKNGATIAVQVTKDAAGTKGAAVTSQLTFTGKRMVLITNCSKKEIGVSKKITDEDERRRLKAVAKRLLPSGYGVIIRTICEGISEEELRCELSELLQTAEETGKRSRFIKGPAVIKKEAFPYDKAIKELFTDEIEEVIVNGEFENVRDTIDKFYGKRDIVKMFEGKARLFNYYNLEKTIEKLLSKKVWLKSGGFLIIEQTEACVIIDVNTGKFSGKRNHDETILKTNLEAVTEVCRQMRLRNLSGMIIIDFIDMKKAGDIDSIYRSFSKELKKDRISTNIVGLTKLGLMQLTRKKTREPLSGILQKDCVVCGGTGKISGETYVADRIMAVVDSITAEGYYNRITVSASEGVIRALKAQEFGDGAVVSFEVLNKSIVCDLDYFEIGKERV